MQMNPMMERIVREGICPAEINMHNATRLMDWVRDTDTHHAKDECPNPKGHCAHAPGQMTVDWAATIVAEAAHICTCGEHGEDNPDTARGIVVDFQTRWGAPSKDVRVKR